MGTKRKGTKRGGETAETRVRRELVKRLLIEGLSEPEIAAQLAEGVAYKGRTLKAALRVVQADLQRIGEDWRGLHDDPEVTEREVGAIRERVRRIATASERAAFPEDGKRGDPAMARVALNANAFLLRLVQLRDARWRPPEPVRLPSGGPAPLALPAPAAGELSSSEEAAILEVAARVRGMTDAELLAHVRAQRARLEAVKARVINAPPDDEG